MEELSASVLEIAKNAETTANLSEDSRHAAEQGSQQFATVLQDVSAIHKDFQTACDSVDDLSNKADAIGAIAQTIEDIADQTNLLALNAAIEAARAGEAGRGFAVVADEVRKLAEKTMSSTSDVGNAIGAIQKSVDSSIRQVDVTAGNVESATTLSQKSGEALREIVGMVDLTVDQVRGIATSSEEQSAATESITQTVTQVSSIATETATIMHTSARAVAALADEAKKLNNMVTELKNTN